MEARDRFGRSPLHLACEYGRASTAECLLDRCGVRPGLEDKSGRTALHLAACCEDSAVCRSLASRQPQLVSRKDGRGRTPIFYSALNVHPTSQGEATRLLIEQLADVNARDSYGRVPLHYAAEEGRRPAVALLLKHRGDPRAEDNVDQRTPLHMAANEGVRRELRRAMGLPATPGREAPTDPLTGDRPHPSAASSHHPAPPSSSAVKQPSGSTPLKPKTPQAAANAGQMPSQAPPPPSRPPPLSRIPPMIPAPEALGSPFQVLQARFIQIMERVQQGGLDQNQHITRPHLFTGSWLVDVSSHHQLLGQTLKYVPGPEVCMRVFNLLRPPKNFPASQGDERAIMSYYSEGPDVPPAGAWTGAEDPYLSGLSAAEDEGISHGRRVELLKAIQDQRQQLDAKDAHLEDMRQRVERFQEELARCLDPDEAKLLRARLAKANAQVTAQTEDVEDARSKARVLEGQVGVLVAQLKEEKQRSAELIAEQCAVRRRLEAELSQRGEERSWQVSYQQEREKSEAVQRRLESQLLEVGRQQNSVQAANGLLKNPGISTSWQHKASPEALLAQGMQEVQLLNERSSRADEERRQCLEATRSLKGPIRIMGRVRPALQGEEMDEGCLRVISKQQLEVMIEPRALLTEQFVRNRRKTTGGIRDSAGCKSASVLSEADSLDHSKVALETKTFYFDDLFDQDASDDDIFAAVRDELDAAVDGEAVCILAYGATGSGKTHTVSNLAERAALELERQAVALAKGGVKMDITVQIVEIYKEQLRDLLGQGDDRPGPNCEPPRLKLSVSSSGTTLLGAASRTICADVNGGIAPHLAEALRIGQAQRATSSTAVHGRSSRSHLVMTLFLTIRDAGCGVVKREGKLSLVDLAGCERLKKSEAVGERRCEAQHINRSLSALADVISAKERRVSHVPYRNSKLTQLLQDALGGAQQCRTVVIVALPPTRDSLNDTMHSLQFSSRLTALGLPQVVSRRSLKGSDRSGFPLRRFPSVPADSGNVRDQLLLEVSRWRTEYEKAQAQMDKYRTELQLKEEQLCEEKRRVAELVARGVASDHFERSRAQIFNGFADLNQRIQDVVETTLDGSNRGSASGARSPSPVPRDEERRPEERRPGRRREVEQRPWGSAIPSVSAMSENLGATKSSASSRPQQQTLSLQQDATPVSQEQSDQAQSRVRSGARAGLFGAPSPSRRKMQQPVLRTSRSAGSEPSSGLTRPAVSWDDSVANEFPAAAPQTARGSLATQRHNSPGAVSVSVSGGSAAYNSAAGFLGGRRPMAGGGSSEQLSLRKDGHGATRPEGSAEPLACGSAPAGGVAMGFLRPLKAASPSVEVPTTGTDQRADTSTPFGGSKGARVSPSTPASSPPAWMGPPVPQNRPNWAGPLKFGGDAGEWEDERQVRWQEHTDVKAAPISFDLSPHRAADSPSPSENEARCFEPKSGSGGAPFRPKHPQIRSASPSSPTRNVSPGGSAQGSGVPVFALSPRAAVQPWPISPLTARGGRGCDSPGAPDEAFGGPSAPIVPSSPSPLAAEERAAEKSPPPMKRPRSTSAHRRSDSPREYVVEVISEARARELTSMDPRLGGQVGGSLCESPRSSRQCPPSPALLLCPGRDEEEEMDDTDDIVGHGVFLGAGNSNRPGSDHEGSVSPSSDEGAFRDRLKQSLQLRLGAEMRGREAAAVAAATSRPPPSTSATAGGRASPRGYR
ncbi:unnamed protein product, partial [Polarella glacialis]